MFAGAYHLIPETFARGISGCGAYAKKVKGGKYYEEMSDFLSAAKIAVLKDMAGA